MKDSMEINGVRLDFDTARIEKGENDFTYIVPSNAYPLWAMHNNDVKDGKLNHNDFFEMYKAWIYPKREIFICVKAEKTGMEVINVSKKEYEILERTSALMRQMEALGVDDWEGYDLAKEAFLREIGEWE